MYKKNKRNTKNYIFVDKKNETNFFLPITVVSRLWKKDLKHVVSTIKTIIFCAFMHLFSFTCKKVRNSKTKKDNLNL